MMMMMGQSELRILSALSSVIWSRVEEGRKLGDESFSNTAF